MRSNAEGWPREISGAKEAVSKDGYPFNISEPYWRLNKDVTVSIGIGGNLPEPMQSGFRSTLARYAEELSARHTENMATRFKKFIRDTGAEAITPEGLLNWRAMLNESEQWQLGGLKGFLLAWHDYGFPGVPKEVVELLQQWRIKGNDKGKAVLVACPETGPLTDLEIQSLLDWANMAAAREQISFRDYAYLLTLAMTARRPVQIAALRGKDLLKETSRGIPQYKIRVPRAKQRGGGFRHAYRTLAVIEDLYQVLNHQYHLSLSNVERAVGGKLEPHLRNEIPVFINHETLASVTCASDVADLLTGERPDALHVTVGSLAGGLQSLARLSRARSERTGEFIRLSAVRFRHTRGTKLRRDGFGAYVIAELLDHSDIQNVRVYCENTAQEAAIIDEYVGAKLAPFAQACMGTLVWSEREAIRGNDPGSRVPNHQQQAVGTCGHYGFCASGYRACYTCHHFQPWVEGPHREVLKELYEEKHRTREAGCDELIVQANDQLILAVEHCVSMCDQSQQSSSLNESVTERADG